MMTAAICATREVSWSPSFYRGEQYDSDLGLYYLRARYYNPSTGRFLSRDPKEFNPLKSRNIPVDSRKLHRYLYASGDPVNRIDPRGREDLDEDSALTMIVKMAEFAPVAMAEAIGFCTLAATLYEIEEPGATPADVLFFYQACLATLI